MSKKTVIIQEDKFKVEIDQWNHTLYQYNTGGEPVVSGKFKGQLSKPRWVEVGHYPNMAQCLRKVVKILALESGDSVESLPSYLERAEDLTNSFESKDFKAI